MLQQIKLLLPIELDLGGKDELQQHQGLFTL
jgi:hypothetical protein